MSNPIDAQDAFERAALEFLHCATVIAGLEAEIRLRGWRAHEVSVLCREMQVWSGHLQRASMRYRGEELSGHASQDRIIEIDNDGVVSEVVIGPIRDGGPLHLKKKVVK